MLQHNNTPENLLVEDKGKDTNSNNVNQLQSGFSIEEIQAHVEADFTDGENTKVKFYITADELLKKEITQIPCLVEPFLQQTGWLVWQAVQIQEKVHYLGN